MNWDLPSIAQITGGRLVPASAQAQITGVSTDTRTLRPGELFVPLRGPHFDGHNYLAEAARRGAVACLSEDAQFEGLPAVLVPDTLQALGALAAELRRRFAGPVVAVTGSSGKTTTKEMLASILALTGPGLKTEGNFNNLIGLPLTLLRLSSQDQWAVLEMGMSARREIARLVEIAIPRIGVITNVGAAHLETLQSLDGVARAKGELFAALPAGGTAVINADDPRVLGLPVANGVQRLLYGLQAEAAVRAEDLKVSGRGVTFQLLLPQGEWPVALHVVGRHNVHNALAAAAAALALGVDGAAIARGLEAFRSPQGRMAILPLRGGVTVLEDSYNANPQSMAAALLTLDEMVAGGRRIAVLGDMLELGAASAELHRNLGAEAARRLDLLLVTGAFAAEVAAGAREGGLLSDQVLQVASHEEAVSALLPRLQSGDRVLVKGSRGARMERVVELLRQNLADEAEA